MSRTAIDNNIKLYTLPELKAMLNSPVSPFSTDELQFEIGLREEII